MAVSRTAVADQNRGLSGPTVVSFLGKQQLESMFNSKKDMPTALAETVAAIDAEVLVLSYNDESWVEREQLVAMCDRFQTVRMLAFDSRRYIGAQIGVYNPNGALVGEVSHVRNKEWVVVAGPRTAVTRMTKPFMLERERVGAR